MESCLSKRNKTMQSQYSSSSGDSSTSYSDERSTPSPECSEGIRERSPSIDEPPSNFLNLRLDHPFARRKVSTSSTSSIDSTSLSISGGSDVERNSPCYVTDFDGVPVGLNKFDDIIDKIVELRFSKNNLNSESKDGDAYSTKTDTSGSTENQLKRTEDTKIVKDVNEDIVNGNYESDTKSDDNECYGDAKADNDDDGSNDQEESDEDLVERGPVRPQTKNQSHHSNPYYTLDWLAGTSDNVVQNQSHASDYESTAQQILRNKQFSEKINPCLDKLSNFGQCNTSWFNIAEEPMYNNLNIMNEWTSPEVNYTENGTPHSNMSGEDAINVPIPSIVLNDPGEASLLEILTSGGFQAAQALSDTASVQNPSPGTTSSENWPNSPASSYNVLSSRSHSRASSRAQSPGSSANTESPFQHINMVGSPAEFQASTQNFRVGPALSSSSSSNHSFGDTPSPSSYQCSPDRRIEEQLGLEFRNFSTWCQSCQSSGTVVNSAETIDAIDNNELQLVEEIIRRDQSEKRSKMEEMQVVPRSQSITDVYNKPELIPLHRVSDNDLLPNTMNRRNAAEIRAVENLFDEKASETQSHQKSKVTRERSCSAASNDQYHQVYLGVEVPELGNTGTLISTAQNNLVYPDLGDVYNLTYSDNLQSDVYNENPLNSADGLMDFESSMDNLLGSHYGDAVAVINNATANDAPHVNAVASSSTLLNTFTPINETQNCFNNTWREQEASATKSTFNDFQIPETVSTYRQTRPRRTSERTIAPWPSLNLPLTGASERLKAGLDSNKVQKAMKNLLKRPTEELAAGDEDGDTMLMCLVGNPTELEKKKAYLVPLVERLGSVSGALTMTNNRSEDALYLAAMNCPQMAYVTGYLAAAMLQRGIDVSQKLYHTRGDTLIHAVAAKGDTHGAVLAELLSLRTIQGNAVFDLSKRNYDGRTSLHVAVESHDPSGSGVNSIGTIRLLLENGADLKIKETKCGDTALHMAISLCCDPKLVKALLSNNGEEAVNVPNYNNNTPVHVAAALSKNVPIERQMEICMHLIHAGGLTNVQNRQGKTPLALVSSDRKEAIRNIFHKKS